MRKKPAYHSSRQSTTRFLRRKKFPVVVEHELSPGNFWDRWLTRASFLSQIAMPILAVLGFWYTVLPLYSKAVLEEQVARNQIDLEKQQVNLKELTTAVDMKREEADRLATQIEEERKKSLTLRNEITLLSTDRSKAEAAARTARNEAARQYRSMRASVISTALDRTSFCLMDVHKWETFYSPYRTMYRDATPAVKGERYPDLDTAAACISRLFTATYGFDGLSKDDKKKLDVQLSRLTEKLKTRFVDLDEKLAQARDVNVDENNAEESKEAYWARINRLSGDERVQAINESVMQGRKKTETQVARVSELGKVASSLIEEETQSLEAHFRNIDWLPKQPSKG